MILETHFKKLLTILCLTASLSSQTVNAETEFRHFNKWSNKEKKLFLAYNLASYIDYAQTNEAINNPCNCFEEDNPTLGKNITNEQFALINVFISSLMYYGIGTSKRNSGNNAMIAATIARVGVVIHNDSVGVSWKVAF